MPVCRGEGGTAAVGMQYGVCAVCVGTVCVCGYGLWFTLGSRVVLSLGALREDRSALYPFMACHGASPYRREVPPLSTCIHVGIGNTYGGLLVIAMWVCQSPTYPLVRKLWLRVSVVVTVRL